MFFTTLLAATCATFASALPTPDVLDPRDTPTGSDTPPGTFSISNFHLGHGFRFPWSFSLAIEGEAAHHPSVVGPFLLSGDIWQNQDYVTFAVSHTQELAAYIEQGASKDSYTLLLKYTVQEFENQATYTYYGQTTVYASVEDASVQAGGPVQPNEFKVRETWSTGIA